MKIENIDPKIKAVIFDLDGTLLPMEQDRFIGGYFKLLGKKAEECGYDSKQILDVVWKGTGAMIKNNGEKTNEALFWELFVKTFGQGSMKDKSLFDRFYENGFEGVKDYVGYNPECAEMVYDLKKRGYRVALATNPVFPAVATEARIRWAGLKPEDFEFYTTYENSSYCKPNPKYYEEVLGKLGLSAEECMMVGNDIDEDMLPARALGMKVRLIDDCLINRSGADITQFEKVVK